MARRLLDISISYNMPKRYVGHDTRGRVAPEGGVSINRNIPIRHVLIDL